MNLLGHGANAVSILTQALRRRGVLLAALLAPAARWAGASAPSGLTLHPVPLPAGAPMAQLHAGGPTGLLAVAHDGGLWALSPQRAAPRRLAGGLDPATPLASGHGRIAGRTAEGGLWVFELVTGQAQVLREAGLAPHAGLLVLPLAVLGVVAADHRLVRFEPGSGGRWRPVARSPEALLPDARPLQADLDGRGDGGHIVVLAGPDAQRYRHGVLGDAVEATRVLWLERHGLQVLRALALPPPFVFEDIAPRPWPLPGRAGATGLLTVRAGPDGGQLALLSADPARPALLRLEALGEPVGGFHRWLAPTTDGRHIAAVHTPHIGGVLHVYSLAGPQLARRWLVADVSTHAIGSRETDLAVWLQGRLLLPSQDGRSITRLNPAQDWAEDGALPLPARVVQTTALANGETWAGLLADGQVVLASPAGRRPSQN
ncbi:hypothetical protein IP87_19895 [beta proteobacterium AAP121]|nr:hypothetical protein IP80_10360 [beta proteobacterium AAP65]KPF94093.1 hypothetical protein IP87_19895 [beta proteobacterium AAP121]